MHTNITANKKINKDLYMSKKNYTFVAKSNNLYGRKEKGGVYA